MLTHGLDGAVELAMLEIKTTGDGKNGAGIGVDGYKSAVGSRDLSERPGLIGKLARPNSVVDFQEWLIWIGDAVSNVGSQPCKVFPGNGNNGAIEESR